MYLPQCPKIKYINARSATLVTNEIHYGGVNTLDNFPGLCFKTKSLKGHANLEIHETLITHYKQPPHKTRKCQTKPCS